MVIADFENRLQDLSAFKAKKNKIIIEKNENGKNSMKVKTKMI